uniref:Uncharacterized protein n=1 Tax=Arundo donax TaxID=35708 RepID=A0A0A9EHD1_ARUDO
MRLFLQFGFGMSNLNVLKLFFISIYRHCGGFKDLPSN